LHHIVENVGPFQKSSKENMILRFFRL